MIKKHQKILNLFWVIFIFLIPLPLLYLINLRFPNFSKWTFAINVGIIAYTWMLAALFLASRPRWIEKNIGLPDMYSIHGAIAIMSFVGVILHSQLIDSRAFTKVVGLFALYLFTFLVIFSAIFFSGLLTGKIIPLLKLKKYVEKRIKHNILLWIHRVNIVVVIAIYIHVCSIEYIRNYKEFFLLISIYTLLPLISYIVFFIRRILEKENAVVRHVEMIDKNIVSLKLSLDDKTQKNIKSGDFVFLSFPKYPELKEPHPFSIVNNPTNGEIHLIVDGVGDFTSAIQNVKVNDNAIVSEGYGILNSIAENIKPDEKVFFIAGGVGVAPLIGLIDILMENELVFLFTVQKHKKLLFEDKFINWSSRGNFKYYMQKGRFSNQQCEEIIPIGIDCVYIIAGPYKMNSHYKTWLLKKGINKKQIYIEGF